jgi:hypothetical protein
MKLRLAKFIATTALCLLLASCAQTGQPLPPSLELPKPPSDLRAIRKGNQVTLTWSEPSLTTDRQSVRYIGPTLVCRSSESEITACGNPVTTLPAPASSSPSQKSSRAQTSGQKSGAQRATPQTYTDTLPSTMQQQDAGAEITYAVEVLNRNARGAGVSNRVHVPAIVTLPPPSDLSAKLTGDGVVLSWTNLGEPPKSSDIKIRYRIYRREETSGNKSATKDVIAGEVSVDGTGGAHFTDSSLEWEKAYLYHITAVSIVKRPDSEVQVEGDDSKVVRVFAHDVFPPSVPSGLEAAYSGEGQKPFIDLIWAPVTNADLAGYNVYRSEANGSAVKVNTGLVKAPAYRDSEVVSGKTYTYSVSAVDARGNESARSEETSETVP